ncbi:hypothetical protein CAEBREN_29216 [Caenorhabditis brenneri]|uniref:Uncharacterized protein n=1 Tax=Caenorhabditis brenneri TaxID=135651 RepID=G0MNW6_CAEBE|nr:hypothetical protein CAEBREN_29216 [Caenorhabditis brenneri]
MGAHQLPHTRKREEERRETPGKDRKKTLSLLLFLLLSPTKTKTFIIIFFIFNFIFFLVSQYRRRRVSGRDSGQCVCGVLACVSVSCVLLLIPFVFTLRLRMLRTVSLAGGIIGGSTPLFSTHSPVFFPLPLHIRC